MYCLKTRVSCPAILGFSHGRVILRIYSHGRVISIYSHGRVIFPILFPREGHFLRFIPTGGSYFPNWQNQWERLGLLKYKSNNWFFVTQVNNHTVIESHEFIVQHLPPAQRSKRRPHLMLAASQLSGLIRYWSHAVLASTC